MSVIDDGIKAFEEIEREFGPLSESTQRTLELLKQLREKEKEIEARGRTSHLRQYVYDIYGETPIDLQDLCLPLVLRGHAASAYHLDSTGRYIELTVSRELTEADITILKLRGYKIRPSIINSLPDEPLYG